MMSKQEGLIAFGCRRPQAGAPVGHWSVNMQKEAVGHNVMDAASAPLLQELNWSHNKRWLKSVLDRNELYHYT